MTEENQPIKKKKRDRSRITFRQLKAIVALTQTKSVREAAAKAGIRYGTVQVWLKKPAFLKLYKERCEKLFEVCTAEAQSLVRHAFARLAEEMDDMTSKPSERIRACGIIIETAYRANEITELRAELAEFEKLKALLKERNIYGGDENQGQSDQGLAATNTKAPELRHEDRGEGSTGGSTGEGLQQVPGETGRVHEGDPGIRSGLGQDHRSDGKPEPPAV